MDQPMAALLEIEDLQVSYGKVEVLHGISLRIGAGQAVAVLGPNGAGKSTLLRTISGLLTPRGGRIRFHGEERGRRPPHWIARRGIVHVPENRDIFTAMTVWENLKVAYDNLNAGEPERQAFERVYELFPVLGERRHQPAGFLSGGQQQMLAIARALLGSPRLLMLDEPSLGLARIVIEDIYRTLAALRAQGLTILLIEQNARLALRFADHSHVLVNGRIVIGGPRAEMEHGTALIDHYLGGVGAAG